MKQNEGIFYIWSGLGLRLEKGHLLMRQTFLFLILCVSANQLMAESTQGDSQQWVSPSEIATGAPQARWGQIHENWPYYGEAAQGLLDRSERCELNLDISFINQWRRENNNFRPPRHPLWRNNPEHYNRVDIEIKCGTYPLIGSSPVQFDVYNHASSETHQYFNNILSLYKNNFLAAGFTSESPAGCGYPDRPPCIFTKASIDP